MSDLNPAALRWLANHHGVITSRTLRDAGVGRSTVNRLVATGVLRRAAKGVFVISSAPITIEQRCGVLCAAHPAGVITGPTAGALAGLRRMPRTSSLHFAVLHGAHLSVEPGVRFRQTTVLRELDRNRRPDGIVTASYPRLAFDLAADLRAIDHRSVVQQLLDERRVDVDELVAIGQRLEHPARRGSTTLRRTLEGLDASAPQQSHSEVLLADALRRRGVPVEPQVRVVRPTSGVPARVDLAVPAVRWGIELDIHPEHRSPDGHAADAVRRRELHLEGWQIETVAESDMHDLERLADHLLAFYRMRRRQFTAHPSVS